MPNGSRKLSTVFPSSIRARSLRLVWLATRAVMRPAGFLPFGPLRRPSHGPHLGCRHIAGVAARRAHEFLRHRIRARQIWTPPGHRLVPRQSWKRRCRPGRSEFQPYAGNRGANLTSMRIVIKFAGALLEDDATVRSLAQQVAALAQEGHEILVVHGGGRLFTATLKRMAIESKFIAGLRGPAR